jgi:branched-subunit amino acid aminotransferase/4-amino-4-deoxychorismate lyase
LNLGLRGECICLRGGDMTEGAATNVLVVVSENVVTPPRRN